jgi:hypothetical protein
MTDHREQIEEDKKRLNELGREIQEVRSRTPEYKAEHEQHFYDEGTEGTEYVDNTIVPPG